MSEIRLRFPPSPTGYLHIGGARTAIYNWLYARKHGGTLILRIEDTDVERSTKESIEGIIDGLKWLGITWDEGPYFQSDHLQEHIAAAQQLVASGHAYRCFCSREELDAKRQAAVAAKKTYQYDRTCLRLSPEEIAAKEAEGTPSLIRFRVPDGPGSVTFEDRVYGRIEKAYRDIEDFVIVRSNGTPLYLLSNVVDDIRDRISHVIRGQDGLGNTPRQILIYEALEAPVPVFAHMSLTLDPRKAKISKRSHGEVVTVQFYREHGFLPWALVNFLVLLGWSPASDREIFSREELIDIFSLEGMNKANSIFNYVKDDPKFITDPKALSINAHYLRTMPVADLAPLVRAELSAANLWDPAYENEDREWFLETIDLIRSRFHVTTDFTGPGRAYFSDTYEFDPKPVKKNLLKHEKIAEWLGLLAERLEQLPAFTKETAEEATRALADELGIKAGILINGTRTVVTGQAAGAGLFDVLLAIGRKRVVARLKKFSLKGLPV
ncbi:MAG: glutamate--tRNA ligase [Deltaproteobacteria bacterium]|jgi:glutamyl-tRNA synthetase|nr:glutamate--tRNA ligase [Deltaproteobacteria bacterium]